MGTEPVRTASSTSTGSILKLVNGLASTPVHQYLRRSHIRLENQRKPMYSGCRRERRETHSLIAHPTQPHSGGDHTTMHRFVPPDSSPSAADPGGGAGGSGAAASAVASTPGGSAEQQQQPAAPAAHSADDDVEVVDTTSAELKESLKKTQRLAKVHRVQTETRRSKPPPSAIDLLRGVGVW